MSILDSRTEIKKIDQSGLLDSVEALGLQIQDTLEQTQSFSVPPEYSQVKNVVVSGMGGSALAAHIIKHAFKSELKVPFEVVSHYSLPNYVNADSLVLLSSYSGTTEETLQAAVEAKSRGAKVMVITSGGKLAELAKAESWPLYQIQVNHNPCNQPRLAIGYALAGQLIMFGRAGIISDQSSVLSQVVKNLPALVTRLQPESTANNTAKMLAYAAYDKHIVLVGAEHLIGAVHVANNQINENSKVLTSEWSLPEFNHHYLEALQSPKLAKDTTIFFLFNSALYTERVHKRFPLTQTLIEQKGYEAHLIQATAPTVIEQIFEIIQLGEFVANYLPILYGINPSPIPNVDWFKQEMAK